jgi:hypothetical protein
MDQQNSKGYVRVDITHTQNTTKKNKKNLTNKNNNKKTTTKQQTNKQKQRQHNIKITIKVIKTTVQSVYKDQRNW